MPAEQQSTRLGGRGQNVALFHCLSSPWTQWLGLTAAILKNKSNRKSALFPLAPHTPRQPISKWRAR
jgi:hypothetical protein